MITGGAGFVGSHLAKKLDKQGYKLVIVDNLRVGKRSNLKDLKNATFHQVDIGNQKELSKVFNREKQIDAVIHLAAMHYIPDCNKNVRETYRTNVTGTRNLIFLMNEHKICRLLFASSAAVYKPNNKPLCEKSELGPVDIYGTTKLIAENLILRMCKLFDIDYTIFRLFNVCGKGDLVPHLIPNIIKQVKKTNKVSLGNMDSKRDFVRKEDVADAFILALKNKASFNQIFNIGTGVSLSVKEVFDYIKSYSKKDLELNIADDRKRSVDANILNANASKLQAQLGWSAKNNVVDFIKQEFEG